MPLINCKVELKLKWTKYCVLPVTGNKNDISNNDNANSLSFTILAKDLKDQLIGINIKQKVRIKLQQMNIDIFSNQILLELIDCLF